MAPPRDWRIAESIKTLLREVNAGFPDRSKSSDGTIGDPRHQSRSSDHNAWIRDSHGQPVVSAIDFTHDPAHGLDSEELAEMLLASRDPRIKYVISNRKIASGKAGPKPWKWRSYSGSNPHNKHVHLSVNEKQALYDDASSWALPFHLMQEPDEPVQAKKSAPTPPKSTAPAPSGDRPAAQKPKTAPPTVQTPEPSEDAPVKRGQPDRPPPLGVGSAGIDIEVVQRRLVGLGYFEVGDVDGVWGSRTTAAIAAFKADRKMLGPPVIDEVLKTELQQTEGERERGAWKRPIAPERADATTAEIGKRAPELKPTEEVKKVGVFAAIGTFFAGLFSAVVDNFKDALSWLTDVKSFFAELPGWVWFGAAAAIALYLGWRAAQSSKMIQTAFKKGERL